MRPRRVAPLLAVGLLLLTPAAGVAQAPLRFVGDRDYAPLSFLENGQPRGFDAEVMQAVAQELGRDVQSISWSGPTASSRCSAATPTA